MIYSCGLFLAFLISHASGTSRHLRRNRLDEDGQKSRNLLIPVSELTVNQMTCEHIDGTATASRNGAGSNLLSCAFVVNQNTLNNYLQVCTSHSENQNERGTCVFAQVRVTPEEPKPVTVPVSPPQPEPQPEPEPVTPPQPETPVDPPAQVPGSTTTITFPGVSSNDSGNTAGVVGTNVQNEASCPESKPSNHSPCDTLNQRCVYMGLVNGQPAQPGGWHCDCAWPNNAHNSEIGNRDITEWICAIGSTTINP